MTRVPVSWSYREGRPRQVYVPQDQVRAVQHGLRQDEQAAEPIRRITEVNLALMRAGLLEASGGPTTKEGA